MATQKPRRKTTLADALPPHWLGNLVDGGKIGMGLDVATTEKAKSNPSALAVADQVGVDYFIRLLIRWKTADPAITEAIVWHVIAQLASVNCRARRLCIDATSEKFFATNLRKALAGILAVELVVSSEATQYLSEPMSFKVYMGNLYINTIDDGRLALPDEKWVSNDARQVKRDKGTFLADIDEEGNHADAFDACKLSLHSLIGKSGGPAEASIPQLNSFGTPQSALRNLKNPYAEKFNRGTMINA